MMDERIGTIMEYMLTGNEMMQIWKENQKMLHERQEKEANMNRHDDSLLFLTKTITSIVDMALEVGQCDTAPLDLTPCTRVVRIHKSLPIDILKISHPESILYGGVFMKVKGLIIPHHILRDIRYYTKKVDIDVSKLPSWVTEQYMLGTMKDVGEYGFCFAKDDPITSHVTYASAWEYLEL